MKGERKLSLVKPAPPPGEREPHLSETDLTSIELPEGEPPITEDELREAAALRTSLDRGDDPFALALRAAVAPRPLAAPDLDALLDRALADDPVTAPPTSLEEHDAARLRTQLDEHDALRTGRVARGPGAHRHDREDDTGTLAVALRAAWSPTPIAAAKNDTLVTRALDAAPAAAGSPAKAPAAHKPANDAPAPLSLRRIRLAPRTFATMATVVAMAAGVLLLVTRLGQNESPAPTSVAQAPAPAATATARADAPPAERAPLIASRSTSDLFDATTPFPRTGGESARVDRIAGARASDLRANRFAAWGVR
ncbi:MAG: hypothetical protein R3B70_03275 [Polyangiaceae bacterium]